ncbi:MAG: putative peptidoglycan lipid flippase [Thermoleophilaceae bacterium]|nr:putative peptidoglycan lipid flippase [Thermoleophilaceae bacterium]
MAVDERAAGADPAPEEPVQPEPQRARRLALSTVFFSAATGLSRVAGLVREIVAANYFGVTGAMSAFTIAFQVPNLVRALFADAALQGAFVPIFTEHLEKGKKKEAWALASGLLSLLTMVLGGLTIVFWLAAPEIMPLFSPGFSPHLQDLTVELSRIMFPIVLLLALSGIVVGILNSFEHFSVPALAPVVWNLIIIGSLVGLTPLFHGDDRIYAYAIGVLAGTIVQFLMPLPWLRNRNGRITFNTQWRNPAVWRVLKLMLPVTLALGLINFSALVNSIFGTLVNVEAPSAIDKAFRIYMLPQGLFSVAIATILFPTLSRFAARGAYDDLRRTMSNGTRQILLLLIPSAAIMAVLAVPITRLVYQRGAFDPAATDLVSEAMWVWALSLPANGASLLFSRTFFSLQKPWLTTALAVGNLALNAALAAALYDPLGVKGVVLGSVAGTVGMAAAQAIALRRELHGIEGGRILSATIRILLATAVLAATSYGVWYGLDDALGRSLAMQVVSLGVGIAAGIAVYIALVLAMRVEEARQIRRLIGGRLRRG